MANEIQQNFASGKTLYACRFQPDGDVFLADGASDESWGAGGRDADYYDVAVTEAGSSGHYVGDFDSVPNIAAGVYGVCVYVQAGGNPVDGEFQLSQGIMVWDGSAEVNLRTVGSSPLVLASGDVGDFNEDGEVHFFYNTIDRSGAAVAPSVNGTIAVYKEDGPDEVTPATGVTITRAFDGIVGLHEVKIDLSANSFYEKEKNYSVVLAGETIDTKVTNAKVGSFSIENRWANVHFHYGGK